MRRRPLMAVAVLALGIGLAACDGSSPEGQSVAGGRTSASRSATTAPTEVVTVTERPTVTATATELVTANATATVSAGASSTARTVASPTAVGPSARAVVERYYAAINARDWQTAWELGGRNLARSYPAFVEAFDGLLADDLTVLSSNGSTVAMSLVALQTDGTAKLFEGTYIVRDGVITGAEVRQTGGWAAVRYWRSCAEAERAGAGPFLAGQPGYRPGLDGDADGVACEWNDR